MTSSGNKMEVFTITNTTDSPITITIPSFNKVIVLYVMTIHYPI